MWIITLCSLYGYWNNLPYFSNFLLEQITLCSLYGYWNSYWDSELCISTFHYPLLVIWVLKHHWNRKEWNTNRLPFARYMGIETIQETQIFTLPQKITLCSLYGYWNSFNFWKPLKLIKLPFARYMGIETWSWNRSSYRWYNYPLLVIWVLKLRFFWEIFYFFKWLPFARYMGIETSMSLPYHYSLMNYPLLVIWVLKLLGYRS